MGVYVDQIVGYMVDVTPEYCACAANCQKYVDDEYDGEKEEDTLTKLGFKSYYCNVRPSKGNIMLIYDGMNGEYAKLIYIESAEYYSDNESEPNPMVNSALKNTLVPDDIRDKLQKVYSIIFNSDKPIEVYLQQFAHWH